MNISIKRLHLIFTSAGRNRKVSSRGKLRLLLGIIRDAFANSQITSKTSLVNEVYENKLYIPKSSHSTQKSILGNFDICIIDNNKPKSKQKKSSVQWPIDCLKLIENSSLYSFQIEFPIVLRINIQKKAASSKTLT